MSIREQIDLQVSSRSRPVVVCGESLTKQAFKDEVNINKIIAKYSKTGMISHLNKRPGQYGDVSDILDYRSALEVVNNAMSLFGSLSAEVRQRFANDPAKFVDFMSDPNNEEEAIKLGLAKPRPVKDAGGTPDVSAGTSEGSAGTSTP